MQGQVHEFHSLMDLPARHSPTELSSEERLLRARLILEEAAEVIEALGFYFYWDPRDEEYNFMDLDEGHSGSAQLAKELADLLYVTLGTAVQAGIDIEPCFDLVHANNLTKVGGEVRADGKRMKPEGYKPVSLHAEIIRQEGAPTANFPWRQLTMEGGEAEVTP